MVSTMLLFFPSQTSGGIKDMGVCVANKHDVGRQSKSPKRGFAVKRDAFLSL